MQLSYRWIATDLSPTSHAALIEIEMPSGYYLYQPKANAVVKKAMETKTFPQLIDAKVTPEFMYWHFNYVSFSEFNKLSQF